MTPWETHVELSAGAVAPAGVCRFVRIIIFADVPERPEVAQRVAGMAAEDY